MTFAHPAWFHSLWLLLLLIALRVWAEHRAAHAADSMIAKRLRSLLVASASPVKAWVAFSLQMLAMALFVATLAQPRWGEEKRIVTESGRNVLIAVDTSKSMLADDVSPNRLMRAKLAAQDIVEALKDQRIGLIAFAGRAYLQAPLTTDHVAVVESLQALDTFTIPRGGTAISEALNEAIDAFDKNKARNHGLIIFSDGGEEDSALDALLERAKSKHIVVVAIGVGTESGALVPDPDPERQGDYVRDPATGNPVHVKLEEATLQKMATATGGRYLRLGSQSLTSKVVVDALSVLEATESGTHDETKPIERFYWPLSLGILSLMISLLLRPIARLPRLSPATAGLIFMLAASTSHAAVLSRQETIEGALNAYESTDFGRARDLYARLLSEDPPPGEREKFAYGLGAAAHQLKDYDRAVDAFSRALTSPDRSMQSSAHHSLGNTLFDQGAKALQQQPDFTLKAWTDSIAHYESALRIHDDKSVRENLEFVKKQFEQLKQQQEQQKQQQKQKQKKDKGEKGDDKQDGQKGEDGEEEDGQKGDKQDQKDGKQGNQKDQQKKEGEGEGEQDDQQKDGKQGKGEEQQSKEGEQIPEGQIQAGEQGQPSEKEQKEMREMEMADQKPDDRTGFSKNEARALLRTYNDQMQLQFQQRRRENTVKRDW